MRLPSRAGGRPPRPFLVLRSLFVGLDLGSGLEVGATEVFFFEAGAFLGGASSPESSRAANGFEDCCCYFVFGSMEVEDCDRDILKHIQVRKETKKKPRGIWIVGCQKERLPNRSQNTVWHLRFDIICRA